MAQGRLKVWNHVTGQWEYVAPGIQGATGPQGSSGPSGATGPMYSVTVSSATTATSVTPASATYDMYAYTALASNLTIAAPTGTVNGKKLMFRIKDNGTSRTLTWNAIYRPIGLELPTSTTAGKVHYIGFIYNAAETKWDCIAASVQE